MSNKLYSQHQNNDAEIQQATASLHAYDANESNIRAISQSLDVGDQFLQLHDALPADYKNHLDELSYSMIELTMQLQYTSRSLRGALTPHANNQTDQKQLTRQIMSQMSEIASVMDRQDSQRQQPRHSSCAG